MVSSGKHPVSYLNQRNKIRQTFGPTGIPHLLSIAAVAPGVNDEHISPKMNVELSIAQCNTVNHAAVLFDKRHASLPVFAGGGCPLEVNNPVSGSDRLV